MPLTDAERAYLYATNDVHVQNEHQRLEVVPPTKQKIGYFTIICLILNRTIGSGIFSNPHRVLGGTGCVGGFFLLWLAGALVSLCALYVWLECGLSMPQRTVEGEDAPRGVPRSGGEKNFLETMFPNPRFRTTCCFAIMFILLYNLSGNALAFAIAVMIASGRYVSDPANPPDRFVAAAIAVAVLSLAILLHVFSRRGGLLVNNFFAMVKVLLLIAIICMGFAKAAGRFPTANADEHDAWENFTKDVWTTQRKDVSSWSNSLVLCMYAYSGYEQPFYVLAETKSPRRSYPRATVVAMLTAAVLFMLMNVVYLLVVPKSVVLSHAGSPGQTDLATLFFQRLFADQVRAARAVSGLIAFAILGNIIVMTFTAARVKQEIAKEGILPWSLTIATSHSTPWGMYQKRKSRSGLAVAPVVAEEVEQSPVAAFVLHWLSSVFLILITLPIKDPGVSYYFLVSLYSYVIITLIGAWVSIGLLWTKLGTNHLDWKNRRRYRPWLSPIHAVVYATACLFMLIAAFAPPSPGSPYHENVTHLKWYLAPTIGLSAPLWGLAWYLGLVLYQQKINRELTVSRTVYIVPDDDCDHEYLQKAEIIDHAWPPKFGDGVVAGFKLRNPWGSRPKSISLDQDDGDSVQLNSVRPKDDNPSHPLANDGWRQFAFSEGDDFDRRNETP